MRQPRYRMTHHLGLMTLIISVLLVLTACNEQQQTDTLGTEGDSLINAAYKMHDYERILSLADLHQQTGSL